MRERAMVVTESQRSVAIDNGVVRVEYRHDGRWSAWREGVLFCTNVSSARAGGPVPGRLRPKWRLVRFRDNLGSGKAIEATWAARGVSIARTETIFVYETLPFVCLRVSLRNRGTEPLEVDRFDYATAALVLGGGRLSCLTHEGPFRLSSAVRTSYCAFSVAEPKTRVGVVGGYLTNEHAMTRFDLVGRSGRQAGATVEAFGYYGGVTVPPGATVDSEVLALGRFDDALEGLEMYASACAEMARVRLPARQPDGYCTWYHARASNQGAIAKLAEFARKELVDFGFELIQIDDGWQVGGRNYVRENPNGPYPGGMRATSDAIADAGCTPGLWFTPFGWGKPKYSSDMYGEMIPPELADSAAFMREAYGSVFSSGWGGESLDCTNPNTRAFLRQVVRRMVKEWGYPYLKLDALYSGMGLHLDDDKLLHLALYDKTKTPVDAYREGLGAVRQAAGRRAFLLGCNVVQHLGVMGPSIGLLDGMRIGTDVLGGPDLTARWHRLLPCVAHASWRYYWHGRAWYNDPDCLLVRPPLSIAQARAWASLIAVSGQMVLVSEDLPRLSRSRLEVLKRVLPSYGVCGRPLDLFERELPQRWLLDVRKRFGSWHVLGLFNWDEQAPANLHVSFEQLGLRRERKYVLFENWSGALLGIFYRGFSTSLAPSSCQVVTIHEATDRPVVLGTTRHILGGAVELKSVRWDSKRLTLSGTMAAVKGRRDTVSIYVPDGLRVAAMTVAGRRVTDRVSRRSAVASLPIAARSTGEVAWEVAFATSETKE